MASTNAVALIRAKREGRRLDAAALAAVATGLADGSWCDAQVGAFAMAVADRGMDAAETRDFTVALRDSGHRLRWDGLPGPVLDKHSTGGVGDGVSLLLAPLLAACGAFVPMISGRGLGHTGGTLDKLESLPGYDVQPDEARFRRVVETVGCAIVGQSADLVPADRRLYAVRDVTATVDVPELIVASILSKKLAGGADALVLDVKTGSGAQTPEASAAAALARRLQVVASGMPLRLRVAFSDMGQVLGRDAGNALEVAAVLDLLRGRPGCPRLRELTLALAAELLVLGGLSPRHADARRRLRRALVSGAAAERFARMVAALGGPRDLLERGSALLPRAPIRLPVAAPEDGFVGAIDVRALGEAVVDLGGGRRYPGQAIDPAVGLSAVLGRGEAVQRGAALAIVHARRADDAQRAAHAVRSAFSIAPQPPAEVPLLSWFDPAERPA
jgi:thymidine phosphorylase